MSRENDLRRGIESLVPRTLQFGAGIFVLNQPMRLLTQSLGLTQWALVPLLLLLEVAYYQEYCSPFPSLVRSSGLSCPLFNLVDIPVVTRPKQ